MQKHKLNWRERTEARLMEKFPGTIQPFRPNGHAPLLEGYKRTTYAADRNVGISYGFSAAGFALYANGYNLRGVSQNRFGLIYNDGDLVFGIGCFKKEGDEQSEKGYLMVVSPASRMRADAVVAQRIQRLLDDILQDSEFPINGAYIRFLHPPVYAAFREAGFSSIETSPWHPLAPQEDETYSHGFISLTPFIDRDDGIVRNIYDRKELQTDPDHCRAVASRFQNFLDRNRLRYTLVPARETEGWQFKAMDILHRHFDLLRQGGKAIGSTPEDYYSLLEPEILGLPGVEAYIGLITNGAISLPVSVFIGERIAYGLKEPGYCDENDTLALYANITIRDADHILPAFEINPTDREGTAKGFSSISSGCLLYFFHQMFVERDIENIHLGGSETTDLNEGKRRLGAIEDKTHWVVKLREND